MMLPTHHCQAPEVSREAGPALHRGTKEQVPWRKTPPPCAQLLAPGLGPTGPADTRSWVFSFYIVFEANVLHLGKNLFKRTLCWLVLCHLDESLNHCGRCTLTWEKTPARLAYRKACGRFS